MPRHFLLFSPLFLSFATADVEFSNRLNSLPLLNCGPKNVASWGDPECEEYVVDGPLMVCGDIRIWNRLAVVPHLNVTKIDSSKCVINTKDRIHAYGDIMVPRSSVLVSGPLIVGGGVLVEELFVNMGAVAVIGIGDPQRETIGTGGSEGNWREVFETQVNCSDKDKGKDEGGSALGYSLYSLSTTVVKNASFLFVRGDIFSKLFFSENASVALAECGRFVSETNGTLSLVVRDGAQFKVGGFPSAMKSVIVQDSALLEFGGDLVVDGSLEVDNGSLLNVYGSLACNSFVLDDGTNALIEGDFLAAVLFEAIAGSSVKLYGNFIAKEVLIFDASNVEIFSTTPGNINSNFLADGGNFKTEGSLVVGGNFTSKRSIVSCNESLDVKGNLLLDDARLIGKDIQTGSSIFLRHGSLHARNVLAGEDLEYQKNDFDTQDKNSTANILQSSKLAPCFYGDSSVVQINGGLTCVNSWVQLVHKSRMDIFDSLDIRNGFLKLASIAEIIVENGHALVSDFLGLRIGANLSVKDGDLVCNSLVLSGSAKMSINGGVFTSQGIFMEKNSTLISGNPVMIADGDFLMFSLSRGIITGRLKASKDVLVAQRSRLIAEEIEIQGNLVGQDGGVIEASLAAVKGEVVAESEGRVKIDELTTEMGVRGTSCNNVLIPDDVCRPYSLEYVVKERSAAVAKKATQSRKAKLKLGSV